MSTLNIGPRTVIRLDALPAWSENIFEFPRQEPREDPGAVLQPPPFRMRDDINSKLHLVLADISFLTFLDVDAIAVPTDEEFCGNTNRLTAAVLSVAGRTEIARACQDLSRCQTGEARITLAGKLYTRNLIHTVDPKFTVEYETAAETALHSCYRNTLGVLVENRLRSVALPCLYTVEKKFPREEAAHFAIRTIRRFLENNGELVDKVVLYMHSPADMEIYKRLLVLYCPRNQQELALSSELLPRRVGGAQGEPILEDRRIRISARIGQPGKAAPTGREIRSRSFAQFMQMRDTPEEERGYSRKDTDPHSLESSGDFVSEFWDFLFKPS